MSDMLKARLVTAQGDSWEIEGAVADVRAAIEAICQGMFEPLAGTMPVLATRPAAPPAPSASGRGWTAAEDAQVLDKPAGLTDQALSLILGRTVGAIQMRRNILRGAAARDGAT